MLKHKDWASLRHEGAVTGNRVFRLPRRRNLALLTFVISIASMVAQTANPDARGFIGVGLADPANGHAGAVVTQVQPGGPADKAGLKPGDTVIAINGTPIDRPPTMTRIVTSMAPNETARLSIVRTSGERRTIAIIVASPPGRPAAPAPSTSAAPPPPAAASPATPLKPLTVSGYSRIDDPLEHAFTVEVPTGWRAEAGLVRHAALQINPYVRALSPDRMTYLAIGDPSMPGFVPQSEVDRAIGRREGLVFDSGVGGISMILHYIPGPEFARRYGEIAIGSVCPALRFVSGKDRPDLAKTLDAVLPTVIPSRTDGGEAVFTCIHGKQEMEARMDAVTRITKDNVGWGVIGLGSFIAAKSQADQAHAILQHIVESMKWSQAWVNKQNSLSQAAALAINQRAQETLRQNAAVIQKLNAVDENFEAMDNLINGEAKYHDSRTGADYVLGNTNPYKWIDDRTGRIISTPTNVLPPFGYGYRPLPAKQ